MDWKYSYISDEELPYIEMYFDGNIEETIAINKYKKGIDKDYNTCKYILYRDTGFFDYHYDFNNNNYKECKYIGILNRYDTNMIKYIYNNYCIKFVNYKPIVDYILDTTFNYEYFKYTLKDLLDLVIFLYNNGEKPKKYNAIYLLCLQNKELIPDLYKIAKENPNEIFNIAIYLDDISLIKHSLDNINEITDNHIKLLKDYNYIELLKIYSK